MARRSPVGGSAPRGHLAVVVLAIAVAGCHNSGENAMEVPHNQVIVPEDAGYRAYPVGFLHRKTQEALSFDPMAGRPATISYKPTRAARVRVRVVWHGDRQLVLRTIQDWVEREFQVYSLEWDGRDASENVVDNTRCFVTFEGHAPVHEGHASSWCREPRVQLLPPRQGVIAHADLAALHVSVEPRAGEPPPAYRLRGYIDYVAAFDVPVVGGPGQPFPVPQVAAGAPGEHLLTLNLDDGNDHVGVAGVRFRVGADDR